MLRPAAMLRPALVIALAAMASACASIGDRPKPAETVAMTPTQNYSIKVTTSPDDILLAAHASGLSDRQSQALDNFAGRWRDTSGKTVTIRAPSAGGAAAARAVAAIEEHLETLGVTPDLIEVASYDQPPGTQPVIAVGFIRYEAKGPNCGRDWQDFTKTMDNTVNSNFGCAVTANLAAQIANPADLAEPRASGDADAARRETVLNKYRAGLVTSSSSDVQATGAISSVVP